MILRGTGWSGRGMGALLGALAVLGHAPFHLWPLALISFACLFGRLQWAAETDRPGRAGFSVALWWALGYFAAGTYWIGAAFIARGPEFIPLIPVMVGGLALAMSIVWGLGGAYFAKMRHSGVWAVLIFAAVFSIAEFVRGHLFGGFPWNLPGYIFEAGSRPSQFVRWVNIYGLSWLVLLLSACLGQAIFWRKSLWPIGGFAVGIIALYAVGHMRLSGAELDYHDDIRLRLVSVPFDQSEKMDPDTSVEIVNKFISASLSPGIDDVTHLIWPEGAVNGLALYNQPLISAMGSALADGDDTPPIWLFNSLTTEMDSETRRQRYYNASVAMTFDRDGMVLDTDTNLKVKLVPFGEHIPLMDLMSDFNVPLISTNLASISPGPTKTVADFPGLPPVSAQICYEIIFTGFTPTRPSDPPQFILNQSNDAWFGKVVGPAQHANIARFRAIESGLPIIRVASNGVTGMIDPYGELHSNITQNSLFHTDTQLPKPLKFNTKTKQLTFLWLLINLSMCFISATIGRFGVGPRP